MSLCKTKYFQRPIRTKLECENGILSNSPQKKKLIHLLISDKPRLAATLLIQTQESESHPAYIQHYSNNKNLKFSRGSRKF